MLVSLQLCDQSPPGYQLTSQSSPAESAGCFLSALTSFPSHVKWPSMLSNDEQWHRSTLLSHHWPLMSAHWHCRWPSLMLVSLQLCDQSPPGYQLTSHSSLLVAESV